MEYPLKLAFSRVPVLCVLAAACVLSSGGAWAQNDSKRALATRLAKIQVRADREALTEQLTASAVQPLLASWSQRLDETVPPAKQKDVLDKLNTEIQKFADSAQKTIDAQVSKAGEAALVPIFMEKLTEDEMQTIIAYLESPVSAKFIDLGPEATTEWAKQVVDATRGSVETGAKNFDAAANRIVNNAVGAKK